MGGQPIQLSSLRFAPAGSKLAYINQNSLQITDLSTGGHRTYHPNRLARQFVWSPDGEWFAYVPVEILAYEIWAMRVDGTQTQRLVADIKDSYPIEWRP